MSGRFYRALAQMHQEVQDQIDDAIKAPGPDWSRIGHLKRLKLSIKHRMRKILEGSREIAPDAPAKNSVSQHPRTALHAGDAWESHATRIVPDG